MKKTIESKKHSENIKIFCLILFSFLFCLAVKFTWIYYVDLINVPNDNGVTTKYVKDSNKELRWNDEFMAVTNDSYYFAEGARDLAFCQKNNESMGKYYQENCHQEHDLSPVSEPLSLLTYLIYKILPFQFETIIFYMPAFIGALIVIPIILVSRRFDITTVGVIASILTGIGYSYYNRTMVGYYDTDMLTLVFPVAIFASLASAIQTRENKYILITSITMLLYKWWYPQGYSIEVVFLIITSIYAFIDIKKFKANKLFYYKLFAVMFVSMYMVNVLLCLLLVLCSFFVITSKKIEKYILYVFTVLLLVFVYFFALKGITPIWALLKIYVFRDSVFLLNDEINLHFFSVMQTIVESGGSSGLPFDQKFKSFAERVSIYPELFILSCIGYIWLCIKKPLFVLMLPILAVGLLSFSKGIRFSMYAIPSMAFGLAFFIVQISNIIKTSLDKKYAYIVAISFVLIATTFSVYSAVNRAYGYGAGTVFVNSEVKLLDNLKNKIDRHDYIISWWDYGYPLRYYADSKTLIDGGKHEGAENFPVSFILGADQKSAANMARLDVEYTEKRFQANKENINLSKKEQVRIPSNNIAWMMKDYNFKDSNDFLISLKTDINLPQKTRDIYIYLPFRMIDIFPTVLRFSNRNLMTGEEFSHPVYQRLPVGSNINAEKGLLITANNQTIPIKRIVVSRVTQENQQHVQTQMYNANSQYTILFLQSYNIYLLLDEAMYNSVYIQMFFLENYDHNLFELVDSNVYAKIYKLKI